MLCNVVAVEPVLAVRGSEVGFLDFDGHAAGRLGRSQQGSFAEGWLRQRLPEADPFVLRLITGLYALYGVSVLRRRYMALSIVSTHHFQTVQTCSHGRHM